MLDIRYCTAATTTTDVAQHPTHLSCSSGCDLSVLTLVHDPGLEVSNSGAESRVTRSDVTVPPRVGSMVGRTV